MEVCGVAGDVKISKLEISYIETTFQFTNCQEL